MLKLILKWIPRLAAWWQELQSAENKRLEAQLFAWRKSSLNWQNHCERLNDAYNKLAKDRDYEKARADTAAQSLQIARRREDEIRAELEQARARIQSLTDAEAVRASL